MQLNAKMPAVKENAKKMPAPTECEATKVLFRSVQLLPKIH